MICREVKDSTHALHGTVGHARVPQISLDKINFALLGQVADVLEFSAAEVVNHSHLRAPLKKSPNKVRTNEGRTSGHQDLAIFPVHFSSLSITRSFGDDIARETHSTWILELSPGIVSKAGEAQPRVEKTIPDHSRASTPGLSGACRNSGQRQHPHPA